MKHFLYLDNDIVSSIISQSEKGLVIQTSSEVSDSFIEASSSSISSSAEVHAETGGIWKILELGAKLSGSIGASNSTEKTAITKNVIDKVLYDASFDIAYSNISSYIIDKNTDIYLKEGDYIEIKRDFIFVDFDYLESLFKKDGLIDYAKKAQKYSIDKYVEETKSSLSNRKAKTINPNFNEQIQKKKKESDKQFDEMKDIVKAIRSFMPYNRMLVSEDGYIIPLDNKYFRVDPTNIGFRYGGDMVCVGLVTNIIKEESGETDANKNFFTEIQKQVNLALKSALTVAKDRFCIIHPIAVYYENLTNA